MCAYIYGVFHLKKMVQVHQPCFIFYYIITIVICGDAEAVWWCFTTQPGCLAKRHGMILSPPRTFYLPSTVQKIMELNWC